MKKIPLILAGALICAGCMTPYSRVPHHGEGAVMGGDQGPWTAQVVTGGFVETMVLQDGQQINMQITHDVAEPGEARFSHELTIGKFSRVWGSGFTRRSNIYYESYIGSRGTARFSVGPEAYKVSWNEDVRAWAYEEDMRPFIVTVTKADL